MASILESVMLVCFGFSWPINAVKAFRARTAKGTSFAFIMLIIAGYIAGISAKFMSGKINYVLAVYFLNLVMVSTQLCVYFRNRALDKKKAELENPSKKINSTKKVNRIRIGEDYVEPKSEEIKNAILENAKKMPVVLFGGSLDKTIPVAEIAQDYEFNFKMMNRSSFGLSLQNAKSVYEKNVLPQNPESVIIHLGEEKDDVDLFKSDVSSFDAQYLDLISFIKSFNKNIRIALVSVYDKNFSAAQKSIVDEMNRHIKAIAESEKCNFLEIENAKNASSLSTKELMSFMYDIGFDRPLNIKKPLGDICKIIYNYAFQNGILEESFNRVERAAV